ncbi:MAG: HipA domain-containing protein [Gammaproteobacteria bacterium]|nr:HipA domain-containing protein [Gammaproteobacteria bacterium]MBU1443990.1 HipA domain-containing protein [Gammaproteobacteria bacterium]MBU2286877.1 HipA domain-containing protein [Gammaproteobacteria bacterium]MBU2410097.1 HipA domain-containing protein [Gammaproteobacteria bacterium]
MATLNVWMRDDLAGLLSHDAPTNRFRFDYTQDWLAGGDRFPLSPQLPLQRRNDETLEQHSAQVRQFFENLLPEGEALDHAAQAAGTARSNLIGLLVHLGQETAGALRLTLADAPTRRDDPEALREITAGQLSERIRQRGELPFSVWDGRIRLSIAGYQDKIAVYERDDRWYLVNGSGRLASTQIVKPAPMRAQLAHLPAIEHMSMRLARRVGVAAARTRLIHVPEPVLFVERFDRAESASGVERLHIVDGCQALGLSVAMKYERAYGDSAELAHLRDGASLPQLFSLADLSPVPAVDRLGLLRWVILQVLMGNTDAHGKNVSFFYDARGLRLAPAYDMVCMDALDAGFSTTFAMAIGDAFMESDLTPYEWAHFAWLCKLPFRLVAHELDALAGAALVGLDDVVRDAMQHAVPGATAQRFKEVVSAVCTRQRRHAAQVMRFKRSDFE